MNMLIILSAILAFDEPMLQDSIQKPSKASPDPRGPLRLKKTLKWEKQLVGPVVFAPNGKTFAACGMDDSPNFIGPSQIKIWAAEEGEETLTMNYPGMFITSIDFALNRNILVSASIDKTLRIHDLQSRETEVIAKDLGQILDVAPDGKLLAISSFGQTVHLFDLHNKKLIVTKHMQDALDPVESHTSFSPSGELIALSRADTNRTQVYEIEICETRNLNRIGFLRAEAGHVTSLDFSHNGKLIATGEENGRILMWDTKTFKQKSNTVAFKDKDLKRITQVVFSPDSTLMGVGGCDIATILRTESLEVIGTIQGQGSFSLAFSPDGKSLVTSCSSALNPSEVKLWEITKP